MNPLFPTISAVALPLADSFGGHHDWGGGWWVVMALGMLIFSAIVIASGVWLVRELSARRRPGLTGDSEPAALEILDRRLAEGAISTEEYEERRRALLDARPGDEGG